MKEWIADFFNGFNPRDLPLLFVQMAAACSMVLALNLRLKSEKMSHFQAIFITVLWCLIAVITKLSVVFSFSFVVLIVFFSGSSVMPFSRNTHGLAFAFIAFLCGLGFVFPALLAAITFVLILPLTDRS
ncbi:MAG: hypothetical protein ACHQF2_02770 [Flavobacteriales bacterium]